MCSVKVSCNFIKKRLWHGCFPVNFVKFLRPPFLQNPSGQLLLYVHRPILSWLHSFNISSRSSSFRSVLRRCSENMQQIYRRTSMPFALQLYRNHTSAWVFCKFVAYFQNTFFLRTPCFWNSYYTMVLWMKGKKSWLFNSTNKDTNIILRNLRIFRPAIFYIDSMRLSHDFRVLTEFDILICFDEISQKIAFSG